MGERGAIRVPGVVAGAGRADLARGRTAPVVAPLRSLLPDGLPLGSTVVVDGMALAFALAAGPGSAGAWLAALGVPTAGLVAAGQLGVPLDRLVVVDAPADAGVRATAAAALVDAFGVVLLGGRTSGSVARRLAARVRDRGAVLVVVGRRSWPDAPDLLLSTAAAEWEGVGDGWGSLARRRVVVTVEGRRGASRPRRAALWLPDGDGSVAAASEVVAPVEVEVARWGA